ncbi:hypothetical protein Hdeb2414_s0004g00130791 [Helianthus debilis subsp. tardiflorus]
MSKSRSRISPKLGSDTEIFRYGTVRYRLPVPIPKTPIPKIPKSGYCFWYQKDSVRYFRDQDGIGTGRDRYLIPNVHPYLALVWVKLIIHTFFLVML